MNSHGEMNMITKISISWNNTFQNDGFLFFVQRIVEMLDYMTVDIFRVPLLNTPRLVDEYLRICHGAAKPYHLDAVFNEFVNSFENDIVLQYKLGDSKIQQIVNRLNKHPEKRQNTMEFLCHVISEQYLSWSKEYIKFIVPQNKEKKKIERAIRCFVPELLHCGYSRDEIYHSAKQLLSTRTDPKTALDDFLGQYDRKRKTFCVYLGISESLLSFREILATRLGIEFNDDGNFDKVENWNGYCTVKLDKIQALDASAAANQAFTRIELFTSFYQYFGNYGGNLIQNKVLTISEKGIERKLVVNRGKYKSIEDDNPPKIGEMAEVVITNLLHLARCSLPQLEKILKFHNRAISNNGLENGFLNLWSIMEMICVSNPESSKIEQVKSVTVPILKRDYLSVLFNDITDNLKKIISADEFQKLLNDIPDGSKDYEKIAYLILIPTYSSKLDSFVDCLVNYPVLRSRMLNLHDNFKTRKELHNLTNRYAQRITWHLYRIYRARNSIVHSGKRSADLKDLGEHLHAYVDSLVNEIVVKLSVGTFCHFSNVIVDSELQQEIIDEYFKKDEPIDSKGIELIFSQMNSWID